MKIQFFFLPNIWTQNGFDFHHARDGFVVMYKWLPLDLTANVPVYAHTMIGVGGLVVNDKRQILTIKENHAIVKGAWKLPGGYVEPSMRLFLDLFPSKFSTAKN